MKQNTITVFAQWQVKQGELENVLSLLKVAAKKSREEEGNLNYQVFQSSADNHKLMLFEEYIDEDALNFHRNAEHFQKIVVQQIVPCLENREVIISFEMNFEQ